MTRRITLLSHKSRSGRYFPLLTRRDCDKQVVPPVLLGFTGELASYLSSLKHDQSTEQEGSRIILLGFPRSVLQAEHILGFSRSVLQAESSHL